MHTFSWAVNKVHVSVTPCGFRGAQIGVWVGFSWGIPRFSLPQTSFHHFPTMGGSPGELNEELVT